MSYRPDLERRIQDILRYRDDSRASSRDGNSLPTFLAFAVGLLVGVLASAVCAPPRVIKTSPDNQPWQIRYAASDER